MWHLDTYIIPNHILLGLPVKIIYYLKWILVKTSKKRRTCLSGFHHTMCKCFEMVTFNLWLDLHTQTHTQSKSSLSRADLLQWLNTTNEPLPSINSYKLWDYFKSHHEKNLLWWFQEFPHILTQEISDWQRVSLWS